jgi:PAS domain S-box-containing protein
MIGCLGFNGGIGEVTRTISEDFPYTFENVELTEVLDSPRRFELVVLGPAAEKPVRAVQDIVKSDSLLSIVILAGKAEYSSVRQSLQFSPYVGKSAVCVQFNEDTDYAEVFQSAVTRTRQKRSFQRLRATQESRLSQLTAGGGWFENAGEILEYAPISALVVNKDLEINGANKAGRKLLTEMCGAGKTYLRDLLAEKDIQIVKTFFDHHQQIQFGAEGIRGNHFEISISNIRQGRDGEALMLMNDVTDRIEKNRRIELILESLPQIAWTADADGRITFLTQSWFQFTNIDTKSGYGQGWVSSVHPDDISLLMAKWSEAVRRRMTFQQTARLRRHDGVYRWHFVKAAPVLDHSHQLVMWVGTSLDIHEQVTLTEELERKVRERTHALEEMNDELEQFAYVSSHDLQEPLRKILTFASIVEEESGHELNETGRRYVGKIVSTAQRMTRLIKDLLSYTRVNQAEPAVQVSLRDTINTVLDDLELLIAQTNATVEIKGELPTLKARPAQLKQLFYNLLFNAIKFRKPDAAPVVSITGSRANTPTNRQRSTMSTEQYWKIVVKDNGIGFDQQYADQIFTVFQRLHARSAYEGTGIGLAIARKVVANHGGEIFALSAPNEGAEFHVVIPDS